VGFDFSATAIQEILRDEDHPEPPVMVTNFFGLAGANSPLPTPLTELVLERLREKDAGMRDFLDIFNHRLISILYRIRKLHRVGLSSTAPEDAPTARHLYAILGLGCRGCADAWLWVRPTRPMRPTIRAIALFFLMPGC